MMAQIVGNKKLQVEVGCLALAMLPQTFNPDYTDFPLKHFQS